MDFTAPVRSLAKKEPLTLTRTHVISSEFKGLGKFSRGQIEGEPRALVAVRTAHELRPHEYSASNKKGHFFLA